MKRYNIENYPIGSTVHLDSDYPGENREVTGYKQIGSFDYLVFEDGYMAFVGRAELIENRVT